MATFDRFDICFAYQALENDWNVDGWLRERPSNQRRRESIGCQLSRMQFRPGHQGGSFNALLRSAEMENAAEIYIECLIRFGLAKHVDPHDELGAHIRRDYAPMFVAEHFPQLVMT